MRKVPAFFPALLSSKEEAYLLSEDPEMLLLVRGWLLGPPARPPKEEPAVLMNAVCALWGSSTDREWLLDRVDPARPAELARKDIPPWYEPEICASLLSSTNEERLLCDDLLTTLSSMLTVRLKALSRSGDEKRTLWYCPLSLCKTSLTNVLKFKYLNEINFFKLMLYVSQKLYKF